MCTCRNTKETETRGIRDFTTENRYKIDQENKKKIETFSGKKGSVEEACGPHCMSMDGNCS